MKKVIHVLTDTNIGGAGRYLFNLISGWSHSRYELIVVCPGGGELERQLRKMGVNLYTVNGGESSFKVEHVKTLCEIISKQKADIVHTHASLSGRIAGKLLGSKVVITRHGISRVNKGLIGRNMTRFISRVLTDKMIAISRAVKINLIETGVPAHMIQIIYNGIDLSKFESANPILRVQFNIPQSIPVLGMVARLVPEKGCDVALKAMQAVLKEIPEALMVIIGDGPLKQHLEDLCSELNIQDSVVFLGYQEHVENLVADFDVFLMPSITEGLGLALLEAMSLSKPVIASETGGIPEVVKNGISGILVPPGDENALTQATVSVINSEEYARDLGRAAKDTVFRKFSSKHMADKTMDIYDQILQ
jgi:glycosyltransferase involved in cell wall biosynthesis